MRGACPNWRRRSTLHCYFDPPYSVPQRNISSFAQFIPSLLSLTPRDLEKIARRAMAENVPPAGTAAKPPASGDRPGLPYYEKLRRDLRDTLQKKRLLDRNMVRRCRSLETGSADQARLLWKTKSTGKKRHTWKKRPLQATSSRDLTTTSRRLPCRRLQLQQEEQSLAVRLVADWEQDGEKLL